MSPLSIGLRAKTGRAIAVVLRGPIDSPSVLKRQELLLYDPKLPHMFQPYHPVMDLPWEEALVAVQETVTRIQRIATNSIRTLIREIHSYSPELCGVGIVGGGSLHPEKISNPHIRAHAAEGRLFREALEVGAEACGLRTVSFLEKGLCERAASEIGRSVTVLRKQTGELGRAVGSPWRADEKAATLAAWIVLAAFGR